jgi:hypothetical protein
MKVSPRLPLKSCARDRYRMAETALPAQRDLRWFGEPRRKVSE